MGSREPFSHPRGSYQTNRRIGRIGGREEIMHANVGTTDRIVRLALTVVLFAIFFVVPGPLHWVGLLGIVTLVTAFAGYCPLYSVLGLTTHKARN